MILSAYGLGLWGWTAQADELGLTPTDVILRALGSMVVASAYETGPNAIADWRLDSARLLGAAAFVLAASQAIARLLSRNLNLWAGRFRRGHLLIVGDHPVARGLAETASARAHPATWITASEAATSPVSGVLTVASPWDRRLVEEHAAQHARHVVVAFSDEVRQIAAVRDLRRAAPVVPITMNFEDPWFGERMDELENISNVRYVSLSDLALRRLHWQHPPFLIARTLGHARLHVLLIGFGRAGEAVLDDLLLSSLTSFQGTPRVTIVDPDAKAIAISLLQRCPELDRSIAITIIESRIMADPRVLPWDEIRAAQVGDPFSLAYVCVGEDQRAITVAVSLQALLRREGWAIGPICTHLLATGALPERVGAWDGTQPAGLLAFGSTYDFAGAIGLFDTERDWLPRLVHEAYRQAAPDHAVANLPWERLPEELRESNRRQTIHLPAKLASAGLDPVAWISGSATLDAQAIRNLAADPAILDSLAALEHARWMAERRLSGWQHGPVRDNMRRRHPHLVAWDDLPDEARGFDRAIVEATLQALSRLAATA
jgi:hypothetical protein